jgi:hypothetical protein
MEKFFELITKLASPLTFVGALFSIISIVLASIFYFKSKYDFQHLLKKTEDMRQNLQKAIDEYNHNVKEFLQLQGVRAYLRQAIELYEKAKTRVISVARIWYVSADLEPILKAMVSNTTLEADFCGPVRLDGLFPPLLWRLHFVYVKQKGDHSRIRFWALKDLPIRFTVADNDILIAGAPPSGVPEETFGWQFQKSDRVAADFYAEIFADKLKPHCQVAEESLILELKTMFNASILVQTVVNALVTGVYQRLYEPHPHRDKWGREITAVEFESMLNDWLCSLHVRYPARVKITKNSNNDECIEFT